jgi:3-oxoacyl-[acyl-carrier protein] reductase
MPLKGKTALITGSGRNIGRATALTLAREGVNVVVNARTNQAEVDAVADEVRALGVRALPVLADVADREAVDSMVAQALEEFGGIDILVSNVAIRPHRPFLEVTNDEWVHIRGIILDGAVYCSQAAIPSMLVRGWGRVIYMTGSGTYRGGANRAHVSAAKMGLAGLARSLALEMAPHNITVNIISPGTIDTVHEASWYPEGVPESRAHSEVPLGRAGSPEDIAAACRYLISDDGAYVTGQTLHVNGGLFLGW